jgi:hypothetical protein
VLEIRDQAAQIRGARSDAEGRRAAALERARRAETALRAAHEARVLERQQLLARSALKVGRGWQGLCRRCGAVGVAVGRAPSLACAGAS